MITVDFADDYRRICREEKLFDMSLNVRLFQWCDDNTTGRWTREGTLYFFENPADATLFSLKWKK
jgi:hypothetical protein